MQMGGRVALVLLMTVATTARAQADLHAEAVRLNNRGVAQMGQQFTERAADSFADALKKDPKLAQAAINEGIALLTLQRRLRLIRVTRRRGTIWGLPSARATSWSRLLPAFSRQ